MLTAFSDAVNACQSVLAARAIITSAISAIPAFMTFLIGAFFVIVVAFVVATTRRVKYP